MKTLKLNAPYEPLEIDISGRVVNVLIDVSADNIIEISKKCSEAKDKMANIAKLSDDARAREDYDAIKKLNKKSASAMEPAIRAAIGDEGYDAIIEACGGGMPIKKESCNIVMTQVLLAVNEAMAGQQQDMINEKAAHYLSEVQDAQPESDKD